MQFISFPQHVRQQMKALSNFTYIKFMRILVIALVLLSATILTPAVYAENGIHVVTHGESLGVIARSYNVSTRELMVNNGISNPDFIYVGQRLVIPGLKNSTDDNSSTVQSTAKSTAQSIANKSLPNGDGYHIVRRGDTLSQIAKDNEMTLAELLRFNGLTNSNFIWVGQKLRITARVAPVKSDKEAEPKLAIIHIFKTGDSLETLAAENNTSLEAILRANGLPHEKFVWVGQRLRIQPGIKPTSPTPDQTAAPADGYRWIEVNLSDQTLTAWQGDVAIMHTYISSGLAATPTVTGRFKIGTKYSSQRMTGPGYDLPGVPWVMYFYSGYAIHGAYWHNNFGSPMSHGCVNMSPGESQMLYNWAPAGTEVYVHY